MSGSLNTKRRGRSAVSLRSWSFIEMALSQLHYWNRRNAILNGIDAEIKRLEEDRVLLAKHLICSQDTKPITQGSCGVAKLSTVKVRSTETGRQMSQAAKKRRAAKKALKT